MKIIRMITLAAGPQGVLQPGKVYQVDDALAAALIAGRCAVLAPSDKAIEATVIEPPERAVTPRPQRRSRGVAEQ